MKITSIQQNINQWPFFFYLFELLNKLASQVCIILCIILKHLELEFSQMCRVNHLKISLKN